MELIFYYIGTLFIFITGFYGYWVSRNSPVFPLLGTGVLVGYGVAGLLGHEYMGYNTALFGIGFFLIPWISFYQARKSEEK